MNQERLYQVLVGPHVAEKSVLMAEKDNMHAFKVAIDATKLEIKKAIETLFEVNVLDVRTLKVKGKRKTTGRRQGKRSDWKKAYIRLEKGQSLGVEQNP